MRTTGDLTNMDKDTEYNKRFISMLSSDFGMFTKDDKHFEVINFDNYHRYNVMVTNKGRVKYDCDCPDFQNRCRILGIPCKHIMYVKHNFKSYVESSKEIYKAINDAMLNIFDKKE